MIGYRDAGRSADFIIFSFRQIYGRPLLERYCIRTTATQGRDSVSQYVATTQDDIDLPQARTGF
jgi:hypothetical protein